MAIGIIVESMRKLGANPTIKEADAIIKDIELGGGTTIDYPEFLTLMGRQAKALKDFPKPDKHTPGGAKGMYHCAFKIINRSGNGLASMDEIAHFFESIDKPQDTETASLCPSQPPVTCRLASMLATQLPC